MNTSCIEVMERKLMKNKSFSSLPYQLMFEIYLWFIHSPEKKINLVHPRFKNIISAMKIIAEFIQLLKFSKPTIVGKFKFKYRRLDERMKLVNKKATKFIQYKDNSYNQSLLPLL